MAARVIENFFEFRPVGRRLEDLDTPVPVIDIRVVDRNLRRWQAQCDRLGIANRPHIKTHKLVPLAKYQLAVGAKGITVQKLGEAEVMADAGITDILLTFNIVGGPKLRRLAELAKRTDIAVVADNAMVVEGLGGVGAAAGRDIRVLVECDSGAGRNGVQSPAEAADLARVIDRTNGVAYGGLMTYPKPGLRAETAAFLSEAITAVAAAGLETETVSTGGTPDLWSDEGLEDTTEYRAGTYIYCDRSLVRRGTCSWEDCAFSVLTTVVSRPAPGRALLDAGSKALTSDLLGFANYGVVRLLGEAPIYSLSEEHGFLDVSTAPAPPKVGDLVHVMPNHVCPVSNLYDRVVFVDGDHVLGAVPVDARGKVN